MKTKKNNFRLLTFSVFFHLFCLFCSVYRDTYRWKNGCYKEANYWFNFFGWWCVQASLITIVYFIYKLFKKSKDNYFDKIFDLIVINANIITISIFTISATFGMLPLPKSDEVVKIFSWEVSSRVFWWSYAVIWHYLAPILTIAYFVRRKISLATTYFGRRRLFLYSFLHPLFYFIFVLARPAIPGATEYPFTKKSQYPYFFFDWIAGNDFRHIVWGLIVVLVIFFWLVIFWLSTLFFWWYANHKLKVNCKNDLTKKKIVNKQKNTN